MSRMSEARRMSLVDKQKNGVLPFFVRDKGGVDQVYRSCFVCGSVTEWDEEQSEKLADRTEWPVSIELDCGHAFVASGLRHSPSGGPKKTLTGWWLRIVDLERVLPQKQARVALGALYEAGYRSLAEIRGADRHALSSVENIGPKRMESLMEYLGDRPVMDEVWSEVACERIDRLTDG